MTDNGKIGTAILGVMSEVGYVQKQRAAGLNYSFASEAALIEALRPAMLNHGIFASVVGLTEITQDGFVTKSGTAMNRTFVHGVVRFTHPASETFIDVHAMGEGMDAGDKSANKAATGLLKYALRQTFLIETGDDPDKDSSSFQERAEPAMKTSISTKKSEIKEPIKLSEDWTTMFWQLANQYELDKEQAAEVLRNHDGNFHHAYEALKASLKPEGPAQ